MQNWRFWSVVLEKTLESPLDYKELQQVKKINPEYSLEGSMLKLELQYFGQLMWRTYSLEKMLLLGKVESKRRAWQRMRWLDGITDSMTWVWARSKSWWRTEKPGVLQSMGLQRVRHDWVNELNWTCSIANAICNCHVSPSWQGSPKPKHIFLVSLHPCTEVTA